MKLNDLVNSDIERTLHWDLKLDNPIDIYSPSNKDFQNLFFCKENLKSNEIVLFERLHRLFSKSTFKISKIYINRVGRKAIYLILNSRIFVVFQEAIAINEVLISNKNNLESLVEEDKLLNKLTETYENKYVGLMLEKEVLNIIKLEYKYYINYEQNKWDIKHVIPMYKGGIDSNYK